MDFLLAGLARHGYAILFAAVLMETIGLAVPAAIALLIAGGACAHGSLHAPLALVPSDEMQALPAFDH